MRTISVLGKSLFLLTVLGFIGAAVPASAEASDRVVVRTERRWVEPRYETRYYSGVPRTVVVQDGYWDSVPIYSDSYVDSYYTPSYSDSYYSTPYYSSYSYPSYYSSYSYPYYSRGYYGGGYYGGYGPSVGLNLNFGSGSHRHRR